MLKRFFLARAAAYIIDILSIGLVFSAIVIFLNIYTPTNIYPPALINFTECEQSLVLSSERMQELLPLQPGEKHNQLVCTVRPMLVTQYNVTRLLRVSDNRKTKAVNYLDYTSNKQGNPVTIYGSEPIFYLLLPLILAFTTFRTSKTLGKRIMTLCVLNDELQKPTLKQCLIREYFKFLPFVIMSIIGIYDYFQNYTFDLDASAKILKDTIDNSNSSSGIWAAFAFGAIIFIAFIWHQLGSFIRWKGKTYWDRLAGLQVESQANVLPRKWEEQGRSEQSD